MNKWQFEYTQNGDGTGTWQWVRVLQDGARQCSERQFDSFYACEADAAQHGYMNSHGSR